MTYFRLAGKMPSAEWHTINVCYQHTLNSKLGLLTKGFHLSPQADIPADSLAKAEMLILKFAT